MVTRFVILPVVFVLSGVPAAAIVCDLVLCPDRVERATASAGCHDHARSQSGEWLTTRTADCTHMSPVDPYVASGSRVVFQPAASAPVASIPCVVVTFRDGVNARLAHGPPTTSYTASSVALRI